MTPLVTPDEMRAAEAAAVAAGTPERELMRRAATAIADWLCTTQPATGEPPHVLGLIGPGNNGGDALVCLALLASRGWRATAVAATGAYVRDVPASPHALRQVRWARELPTDTDVVLDGIFGIGSRDHLPESVAALIRQSHEHAPRARRVAIDVPSGCDAATGSADASAFRADTTICLGLPKRGLVREPAATHVGELLVFDIGIPPLPEHLTNAQLLTVAGAADDLPQRTASAHKHGTGTLLIVGGSAQYYGAPRLSAEAALRTGCGLVSLAVPPGHVPVIATQLPEATFVSAMAGVSTEVALAEWIAARGHVSAMLIGPGMGRDESARDVLTICLTLAETNSIPVVLDADALSLVATHADIRNQLKYMNAVLTPHTGELARLLNVPREAVEADPVAHGVALADSIDQAVVVKSGFATVVVGSACAVSPRAVPELATAGTGDVLAGLIAGFLAQVGDVARACRLGVAVGSLAGWLAREQHGPHGLIATDVPTAVPHALRILAARQDPRLSRH